MNKNDNAALLAAVTSLEEAVKLVIQVLSFATEHRLLKSAESQGYQYKFERTVDLGQGATRLETFIFELGENGYLTLVDTKVKDNVGQ